MGQRAGRRIRRVHHLRFPGQRILLGTKSDRSAIAKYIREMQSNKNQNTPTKFGNQLVIVAFSEKRVSVW